MFAKITGRENLNTVAFQCSRKLKRQNYGVQNNYIDSNDKIKGGQNWGFYSILPKYPDNPEFRYVTNQRPKANSAFHPSVVGKWVPASAGKAKAGMVHSVSGWTRGVQVKL